LRIVRLLNCGEFPEYLAGHPVRRGPLALAGRAGPDLLRTRAGRLLDQGVQAALDLNQDTLDRARRVLGADHPDTLISANNLAAALRVLGEVQAARELDEDTLGRRRRLLGEDHPRTIRSARNLARDLRLLGEAGEGC
jgi:Tetratricopeptide repeat